MSSKTQTTATKEEATPALVPKLRFPEFRGAIAWRNGRIADIAVSESSSRALNKLSLKSEGYPVYGADSCVGYIDSFDQADDYIAIVKDGSGVGRLALKRGQSSVLGTLAYVKCKPGSETKLAWLYYCLSSLDLRQFIKGSGIPHIYFSDYATHEVLIPAPAEQQKIAECLSSVDELMAAQARKVDALKTHKKGLMQQLFPREGETQPRLRFPEFQNAGEWIQKTVGDVSEVLMCKRIFAEETNPTGGVPFYKIGTLGGVPDAFISREQFEDYKRRYNFPRKGEVLITCSGTVGKCLPFDGKDAYFQDSNIVWLDNPKGEVSNEFLLMLLSNVNWGRLNSTTITRIYGPDLRGLAIKFPKDDKEQQRIATCLSSLDALITAETQKHEALKTHKKGLMQQLFPSPEEV
jgi:type I restriction enzyme, S subunit